MHSIVEQEKNTRTPDINNAILGYIIHNTTTHLIHCFNNPVRQIDLLGILVRLFRAKINILSVDVKKYCESVFYYDWQYNKRDA